MTRERKKLPSCLRNGHLTISKGNENSNFNLLTHYLILQNCIFIACASMETNKKEIIPDNQQKKNAWLIFFTSSIDLFHFSPSLDSYLLPPSFSYAIQFGECVRMYLCVYIKSMVNFGLCIGERSRNEEQEEKNREFVCSMIVYCHIFAAHRTQQEWLELMALFIQ